MPKLGEAQSQSHPWRKAIENSVNRARAIRSQNDGEKPRSPRKGRDVTGWTCPACGSPSCTFGECVDGDY